MAATLAQISTQIKNLFSGVTGIGQVHEYLRWAVNDKDFQTWAVTSQHVNVWQISRLTTEERWLTTGEFCRAHLFAIYGAYGSRDSDASEQTFQTLVERIAGRFRTDAARTLNETVETIAPSSGDVSGQSMDAGAIGGVQVTTIEHRMLRDHLVHWCELRLGVQEFPQLFP